MGRKRSGTRQFVFLCATWLIIIMLAGCASLTRSAHLQHVQQLISQGDFEGALRENQKVLSTSPKSPPGDAALFNMGLIYVHFANPQKDYKKALGFFTQLEKDFPRSPYKEEAKTWIGVLRSVKEEADQKCSAHLERVQRFIDQGDFQGALRENQKVLSTSPKSPPGDAALFSLGLICVHDANPNKNFQKALDLFRRLEEDFPRSPLAEEAKLWVGVLETIERAKQIDIEIEAKKKKLTR